jgi:hypothetical protein
VDCYGGGGGLTVSWGAGGFGRKAASLTPSGIPCGNLAKGAISTQVSGGLFRWAARISLRPASEPPIIHIGAVKRRNTPFEIVETVPATAHPVMFPVRGV